MLWTSVTNGANTIGKTLTDLALTHARATYHELDPVKDVSGRQTQQQPLHAYSRWHYRLPLLVNLIQVVDAACILMKANFVYTPTGMSHLLSHKVFPREYWLQCDVMWYLAVCMALGICAFRLKSPSLNSKYQMFLKVKNSIWPTTRIKIIKNSRVMSLKESQKIGQFYYRTRKYLTVQIICLYVLIVSFYMWQFSLNWTGTLRDVLLAFYIPLLMFYQLNTNVCYVFYFIICVRYIGIQQACQQAKLCRIASQLAQGRKVHLNWHRLANVKRKMADLFAEIRAYNQFWSGHLTIYYVVYIVEVCYFANCFFLGKSTLTGMDQYQRGFFLFFALEFLSMLLLITYQCSTIILRNLAIHRQFFALYSTFQPNYRFRGVHLLKTDGILANQKVFSLVGFTLLNNYRINSQMFELLFYCISTLFLKVIGQTK